MSIQCFLARDVAPEHEAAIPVNRPRFSARNDVACMEEQKDRVLLKKTKML